MSMLELRDVSKVYGGAPAEVQSLRGIDLSVEPGSMVAVMGRAVREGAARSPSRARPGRPTDGRVLTEAGTQ
jgi:hypothetical protein